MIDTHCHLHFEQYSDDREDVIGQCIESGVEWVVNVASHHKDIAPMMELSQKHAGFIFSTVGVHPHHVNEVNDLVLNEIETACNAGDCVAIGEVGLDYYRDLSPRETQKAAFERFIGLASAIRRPMIIHCRDAWQDMRDFLKEIADKEIPFVVHCFSGGLEEAKYILDLGGYVSFTANITYKKSDILRQVVKGVPLDRIMAETDAPYLSPEGMRGTRNTPANVKSVIECIAQVKGISFDSADEALTNNAVRFFRGR